MTTTLNTPSSLIHEIQLEKVGDWNLFKFPNAELQVIFSAPEYPVWSPYDAIEAAKIYDADHSG